MAYDSAKPANDGFLADAPQELRTNFEGLKSDQIVDAGTLKGLSPGNASGNIPISNGTLNINLNAEKLNGQPASYYAPATHTHSTATSSSNGFMSNTDKAKLDTIATGAEVNQNAFSNVLVGSTTIQADSKTDTLELVAGQNISIIPDAVNDRVTIAVNDKVTSAANADYANTAGNANTVDGKHASDFVAKTGDTMTGQLIVPSIKAQVNIPCSSPPSAWPIGFVYGIVYNNGYPVDYGTILSIKGTSGNSVVQLFQAWPGFDGGESALFIRAARDMGSDVFGPWRKIWAENNDGSGSGLDADTVDGYHAGNGANNVLVLDGSGKVPQWNLPIASTSTLGAIKVGNNLSIDANGVLSAAAQINYDAAHSFATNGYQKLSNGLIIQWGYVVVNNPNEVPIPITLPITFPNACLNVTTSEITLPYGQPPIRHDSTVQVFQAFPMSGPVSAITFYNQAIGDDPWLAGFCYQAIGY